MALILAIEPDRKQASRVAAIVKNRLHADIVQADTTEHAIDALGGRVPDLILTSLLLSRKDDAALADWLRESDEAGAHVQTLVIPVLGGSSREYGEDGGGLLSRFGRRSRDDASADGCEPEVFATQIREYLERAAEERRAAAQLREDKEAVAAAAASGIVPDEPARSADDQLPATTSSWTWPAETRDISEPASQSEQAEQHEPVQSESAYQAEPVYFEVEAVTPEPTEAAAVGAGSVAESEPSEDDNVWSEITLGDEADQATPPSRPYSLAQDDDAAAHELTSETIDLQRFVEELTSEPAPARKPAPRRSKDDVLAEFEEALEVIATPEDEPNRPDSHSQADSEVLTPLVGATAWPHLDSTVAKPAPDAAQQPGSDKQAAGRQRPRKKSRAAAPPVEWSRFDPEQCGFAALLAKLDQMAD